MRLDEASAKLRSGPSIDDEDDYKLDCWDGIIPLKVVAPPPDPNLREGIKTPKFIRDFCLSREG
jgi:hypothetical protein